MSPGKHEHSDDHGDASPSDEAAENQPTASALLSRSIPIKHAEITAKLKEGGHVRSVILEAQDDSHSPAYAAFILPSWRKEYCVLHVEWPNRVRLFRNMDRLLVFIRFDYGYRGAIALKLASQKPDRKSWRLWL